MAYGTAHIKIKLNGNKTKIQLFHYIMSMMDKDWPWGPFRKNPKPRMCATCQGYVYNLPLLENEEIRALAQQVKDTVLVQGHMKLKIKGWNTMCPGMKDAPIEVEI